MITRYQFAILTAAITAIAATAIPAEARSKSNEGLKLYIDHKFDYAIESCKKNKDMMSKLVVALSYTEKYNIYKNRADRDQAKIYLNILEIDANMKNVSIVAQFLNVPGNPGGNKEALSLLKDAFKNSNSSPEDILKIAGFLDQENGIDVNKAALSSLKKKLKPVRDYVNKGGTMPDKMKKLFENQDILKPLITNLSEKKTLSYAKSCLTIIEEPTLKLLDEEELTKGVSATIVAVKKAIAKRVKKFPESSWSSALGQ